MIKFVTIGTRQIALHHVCGCRPGPQESLMVTTTGGDIEIPGTELGEQFLSELEKYKKETAPRKPGRPAGLNTEVTGDGTAD